MNDAVRILLVEDDPGLAREIVRGLERDGWAVDHVACLADAFEAVVLKAFRAILLDRRLPDGDGIALVAAAKARPSPPAIIFLTARDEIEDRVAGLDAGADDYLVKPFALGELLARLRALLRRSGANGDGADRVLRFEALVLDFNMYEARLNGAHVQLTRT